ncbi:MAG: MarR family transcriptional regulator [Chloroflexi bacterium]|nr:MarR family transcriptional regulator [Chloroflexota bacterium]
MATDSHLARDQFLHLAQVVVRALHSTNLESWCAVDLTMPQLKALFLAHAPGGASHSDIARGLGVGVSTVTGIVDRLVEHGLVERRTDPGDRRLSRVVVTQAGSDLIDRLWASRREQLDLLLGELTSDERTTLISALQHLAALLGEHA